jgi:acyl-CoA thioesterase
MASRSGGADITVSRIIPPLMNDTLDHSLVALKAHFLQEPYASIFGIQIMELEAGRSLLKMQTTDKMKNLFGSTHGAAIFSLADAAFELAVNSHGTVAVALGVNVNYLCAATPGETLFAEGRETNRSRRISACEIHVTGEGGRLIATFQALAYRKKDPLPFL